MSDKTDSVYSCKNSGCRQTFRWRQQLKRHKLKCCYPATESSKKYICSLDGSFQCISCQRIFSKQSNASRHAKSCKGIIAKTVHQCNKCEKSFAYKSLLERHKNTHNINRLAKKRSTINETDNPLDSNFIPSLVFPNNDGINIIEANESSNNVQNQTTLDEVVFEIQNQSQGDLQSPINSNEDNNRTSYFKDYRERQRKVNNLENIISNLSSPQKKVVVEEFSKRHNSAECNEDYQSYVSDSLINYLKSIWKKGLFPAFHKLLFELFSTNLTNETFVRWLANKMGIRGKRLVTAINKYKENMFSETRGRHKLSSRQVVYDMWLENSIPSTDGRNGRNLVTISKRKFMTHVDLKNNSFLVEEKTNKRGKKVMTAPKLIATLTVRAIQEKLSKINVNVSVGTIISLKPFYVNYATEKEMALCLCKICLNTRLLFEAILKEDKKHGGVSFSSSISDFFMCNCECEQSPNGYFSWRCVTGTCKQCRNSDFPILAAAKENCLVTFSQFELTMTPYQHKNKQGIITEKISKKTERVHHSIPFNECVSKLKSLKYTYLTHRYQVNNDIFHWPQILSSIETIGPIFHMDFSENLPQLFKYEPQSSHFNKKQYSLHCTVKHSSDGNKYIYHLSDHLEHNFAFTYSVINHLASFDDDVTLIRFKSDNCSTQYKCRYIFGKCAELAVEKGVPIIWYYGVSGHGKGLVDAMSSFGVKSPLRKAVITEDLFYDHASDILNYLKNLFSNDNTKMHFEISSNEINQVTSSAIVIKDIRKQHIIAFFPDRRIYIKENICSCYQCLYGDLLNCQFDPGRQVNANIAESNSDIESDDDDDINVSKELEQQEIRGCLVLDVIEKNSFIAIFSPPTSSELFYLCKVLDFGIADCQLEDNFRHIILPGNKYIKCQYLERVKENKKCIQYKLIEKDVFVFPAEVMSPMVPMKDNLCLTISEYQWLSDMI